jgi:hypothetical protein
VAEELLEARCKHPVHQTTAPHLSFARGRSMILSAPLQAETGGKVGLDNPTKTLCGWQLYAR